MGTPKFILAIFLILFLTIPGVSLVLRTGKDILVAPEEIIDDDLVAMGRTVKIQGIVNGDLFAFAQEVIIENTVNGSIYTGGADININTKKCRSIWALCGSLKADANIENNLLFFGGQLKTHNTNIVKKDMIVFGGEININGEVQGQVKGNAGKIKLNGKIKSVDIVAEKIYVNSDATVMEDFKAKSKNEPVIDANAKILGNTEFKKIENKTHRSKNGIAGFLKTIFFISKLVIGIILIAIFKPYIKKTNQILQDSTWKSLGFGFLTIIVIPIVSVLTLATIIGIPVAIFGVFVFLSLAYISGIIFSAGLGEWIIKLIKKESIPSPILSFLVGFILITLICLIPYLGFIFRILILFFGTGMIILLLQKLWKNTLTTVEEK
ncbi:MAG: hypothetical protein ACUVUH_03030 [bacterium]